MKRAKVKFDPAVRRRKEAQRAQILEAKRQQKEEKIRFTNWLTNNRSFDFNKHASKWDSQRKKYAKIFTDQIVLAMGLINGARDANDLVSIGLKMPDAGIELESLHDLAYNIFTIKLAEILVNEANFQGGTKQEILDRIVAQIFPVLDKSNNRESPPFKGDNSSEMQAILTTRSDNPNQRRTGQKS